MVDIASTKYSSRESYVRRSYGVGGSRKSESCAEHALEAISNVISKMCAAGEGFKQPSYGMSSRRKPECFAQHASKRLVVVSSKTCERDGCRKQPRCGGIGSSYPEYCSGYAADGMTDLVSKNTMNGCLKRNNHEVARSRGRAYCAQRAPEGMLKTVSNTSANDACPTRRIADRGKQVDCAEHALEEMVHASKRKPGTISRPVHESVKKMKAVCSKTHTSALVSEDYVKSEFKVSM